MNAKQLEVVYASLKERLDATIKYLDEVKGDHKDQDKALNDLATQLSNLTQRIEDMRTSTATLWLRVWSVAGPIAAAVVVSILQLRR